MRLNAYLTIKGQRQGDIKGSVTQKGREGSILVHAYSCETLSPRDPASGLPTGKRTHEPVMIVKEVARSSAQLWAHGSTTKILFKRNSISALQSPRRGPRKS
jgi:type VI secretion system secreted protein Hcp